MSRKLLFLLAFSVIALIVAYRWRDWDFDWSLFFSTLWSLQPAWLAASILATALQYVSRAYRWQVLLSPLKAVRIEPLLTSTLLGFSAIFLLGRPAELIRPVWLTRQEHVPFSATIATLIVERMLDLLLLVALLATSLIFVEVAPAASRALDVLKQAAWVMVSASVVGIGCMFIFRSNVDRIAGAVPIKRLASMLHSFAEGLSFLRSRRTLILAIAHSVALWIVIVLQFWFTLLGMNFEFSLAAATLVMVGVAIGSIVQIPGVGGGFQVGFVFCMTTFFGVPAEQAIAGSLVALVFSNVPTLVITGLYMMTQGMSFSELRATAASK
jgi:glycosyltransferase 2 family protein